MHSSSCGNDTSTEVRQGDSWLAEFLPKVLASSQYRSGSTAIFVTWDEDDYSKSNSQHIPTLVIAPSVPPGTAATARFDHYALLRTTEELLGLNGFLGAAATAPTMRAAFHL
jgi:phosphatidylinositol-3-phosphatase